MNIATRAVLGAAVGAATALTLAAPVGAAAPTLIDAEYWGVSCVAALPDGSTVFLFGGGTTDGAEGGIGAFLEDADGNFVGEGTADSFAWGESFAASVPLGEHRFTVRSPLTRGAAVTEVIDERDGNSWTRGTTTTTDVTMSPATATYDGADLSLAENACHGDVNAFRTRTTNPTAQIHRDSDFDSEICDLDGLADGQVRISGILPDAYAEVVLDHGGEDVEKLQGEIPLRGGRGTLSTDVLDVYTGEVRTTATVALALTKAGRAYRSVESSDGFTETRTVTPYREDITVTFADGRKGTATCSGIAVDTMIRIKPGR